MAGAPEKTEYPFVDTHMQTWALFTRLAKWVVALCVLLLVGMALFLTGAHDHVVR